MSGYNVTYKAEVAKSTKKDAITAMCFLVYLLIVMYALGTVLRVFAIQGIAAQALGSLVAVVGLAPCLVIVLIKRQGLSSIGIRKENLWPALRLGLLFSAFVLMLNRGLLPGLIQGWQFQRIYIILYLLIYSMIMAAWEDIIFTGYIQTRLYGVIKNDILAVLTGAFLFAVMHVPMWLAIEGISALSRLISVNMLVRAACHIIFNLVFRRYFSVFPIVLFHAFLNFSNGRFWISEGQGFDERISFVIIVLSVVFWALYVRRKSKKALTE